MVGTPKSLHKDGGKEFNNHLFYQICQCFGIHETTTPAYSPWFNGVNERNHATVDRMMTMIMGELPQTPAEEALFWSIHAFNTLESSTGFTPMQLMFGSSPRIPTLLSAGPMLMPEVTTDGAMSANLQSMQEARKASLACENDKVLKQALKSKINVKPSNIQRNS